MVPELGIDPKRSPRRASPPGSSFVLFAIGAIVPLDPVSARLRLARRRGDLWRHQACWSPVGPPLASPGSRLVGVLRQLGFGAIAIAGTYAVGTLIGTVTT